MKQTLDTAWTAMPGEEDDDHIAKVSSAYASSYEDPMSAESDKGGRLPSSSEDSDMALKPLAASEPASDAEATPDSYAARSLGDAGPSAPSSYSPFRPAPDTGEDIETQPADAEPPPQAGQAPPAADLGGGAETAPISTQPAPVADGPPATGGGGGAGSDGGFLADAMGWGPEAFAEAGGYDAVFSGELPCDMFGGSAGDNVYIFIDELNITNNTLIQETNITLIADDGGILEIEGDFTAIQTQESLVLESGPVVDEFDSAGALGPDVAEIAA